MFCFINTPELLLLQKFCPITKHWLLQNGWCTPAGLINQSGTERGCSEDNLCIKIISMCNVHQNNLDLHQNNWQSKPISMMQLLFLPVWIILRNSSARSCIEKCDQDLSAQMVDSWCKLWTANLNSECTLHIIGTPGWEMTKHAASSSRHVRPPLIIFWAVHGLHLNVRATRGASGCPYAAAVALSLSVPRGCTLSRT